ncbi:MAG: hypothetical protein Kow0042_18640 [Calditrichia bacterium]
MNQTKVKSMINVRFALYQGPAIFWTILIFVLSSIPSLPTPDLGFSPQDKIYHLIFYTVYGFFLGMAFYYQEWSVRMQRNWVVWAILFGTLYAISDEIHQYFVPGRKMEFWDIVADSLGVILGVLIFRFRVVKKSARSGSFPDSIF